jgi:diguanylate cyclase
MNPYQPGYLISPMLQFSDRAQEHVVRALQGLFRLLLLCNVSENASDRRDTAVFQARIHASRHDHAPTPFRYENGFELVDDGAFLHSCVGLTVNSTKISAESALSCRIDDGDRCGILSMSGNGVENQKLDLTAALRILQNAGRIDPRLLSNDANVQIQNIIDALCDLSVHDGLTGLVNATFFHAVLTREIERSLRTGRSCALIVIDIDFFKAVNDTYGHNAGDTALQAVARELKHSLRSMDTAARIGGEEFAVILPECAPEDAIHAATRIHSVLNPITVRVNQKDLKLTTSAGLVWTNLNISTNSTALLSEADQEMYRAKRAGRGRLCYQHTETTAISGQERSALMSLLFEEGMHGR